MKETREIHRRNLELLCGNHGSQVALVGAINKKLPKSDKPLDQSQISNALRGRRPFGEKLHRKIESALGLPSYWFEMERERYEDDGDFPGPPGGAEELLRLYAAASEYFREEMLRSMRILANASRADSNAREATHDESETV